MSEPTFTKGPWLTFGADPELRDITILPAMRLGEIAVIPFGKLDQERDANAFLIAAAPDLYEAAVILRHHLQLFCGPDDAIANAVFRIADGSLAKARGETVRTETP